MINFKEVHIKYGNVKNAAQMPYKFEGKNNFNHPVYIIIKPGCGCTTSDNPERTLQPGEEFTIEGFLKKRSNKVTTTKSITVTVRHNSKEVQTPIRLLFTMNIV